VTTSQSSTVHGDADVWGVCNLCRSLVIYGDRFTHPCEGYYVDTSWNARANPHNTPWFPGYRFWVEQASGARSGRKARGWITPRTYRVEFEITEDGRVRHTRGVKPTDQLLANVEAMYLRERPGSNWYPGCEGL
jgi:hypothetical protein